MTCPRPWGERTTSPRPWGKYMTSPRPRYQTVSRSGVSKNLKVSENLPVYTQDVLDEFRQFLDKLLFPHATLGV